MLIGNRETPLRILMVASLDCGICRDRLEKAKDLIALFPEHAHMAIRLRESGKGGNDTPPASSYIIRYWEGMIYGRSEASTLLHEVFKKWFSMPSITAFMEKYPLQSIEFRKDGPGILAKRHYKWTNEAGIIQTPKFFINGFELPHQYEIGDLMRMIPGTVENLRQSHNRDISYKTDREIAPNMSRSKV